MKVAINFLLMVATYADRYLWQMSAQNSTHASKM